MNWFVLIAGLFTAFVVIGHFAVGSKEYLKPMLAASFDEIPKKVMHCVFHYVSAYLILSALALLLPFCDLLAPHRIIQTFYRQESDAYKEEFRFSRKHYLSDMPQAISRFSPSKN